MHREQLAGKRGRSEVEHRSIAAKTLADVAAAAAERQNGKRRARADLKDFFNEFGVSSQRRSQSALLGEVKPAARRLD
jgi:hypothetical protein